MELWAFPFEVTEWIDGDTVKGILHTLLDERKGTKELPFYGRLLGIDAPDRREPLFYEAAEYADSLAPAGQIAFVRVVPVKGKIKDSFGRYFVEVYTPTWKSINQSLLASGFASVYVDR